MSAKSDQISGRAKQAVGAITGDEDTKYEGERQEDKGQAQGQARLGRRQGPPRARRPQAQGRQSVIASSIVAGSEIPR
jgi:hypothetical protein